MGHYFLDIQYAQEVGPRSSDPIDILYKTSHYFLDIQYAQEVVTHFRQ